MLAAIKFSHTKNPRPGSVHTKYAMWDLEDLDGIARCILWPEQFAEYGQLVQADAIVGLRGKIDRRPGAEETNVIVDELLPLADLTERLTSGLIVRIDEQQHGERGLEQLREIMRGYPGTKSLKLRLDLASGDRVFLDSGRRIDITTELRERIDALLGPGCVSIQAAPPKPRSGGNNERRGRREPARA
jgi:DNA polymerase-3 subunit alpha